MPRDPRVLTILTLLPDLIRNPFVIGGAALIVVTIIVVVIVLLLRASRSGRERDERARAEVIALERATQFAAAVEQIEFHDNAADAAREAARLFREHLSMNVVALYAGRDGDDNLLNVMAVAGAATGALQGVPASLPFSGLRGYAQPRVTRLSALASAQPTGPLSADQTAVSQAGVAQPTAGQSPVVVVLPWQGGFGWKGLIAASAGEAPTVESLTRYRSAIAVIGARVGVALELSRARTSLDAAERRASGTIDFARSIVTGPDEQYAFASIARGVAALLGTDSAALWRIDPDGSIVRMAGQFGLRSAEFLPLPAGQGLAGSVVTSGALLAIEDAPSDPRCLFPREARESGIFSYLGAPLVADGKTVGVVEVHSATQRGWTTDEGRVLQSAGAVIAEVIRATDERGHRLKVEASYLGLSEALQRLRSENEVMEAAVEVLGHALGVSRAIVVEANDHGKLHEIKHEYRTPDVPSALGASFSEEIFQRATTANGDPVAIDSSSEQSLVSSDVRASLKILSELAVAIRPEGGRRVLLYLHQCDRVRVWKSDEIAFAHRVGRQLELSLANARAMEKAAREAEAAREETRHLVEERARAQAFIHVLPEAVIGLDKEGRVTFFNAAARTWLGLKEEDIGRMAEMTEPLALSDDSIWDKVTACKTRERFEGRLTHLTSSDADTGALNTTQGAVQLPVSIAVSPVRNSRGEIGGQIVVLSDISHVGAGPSSAPANVAEMKERMIELERAVVLLREAEAAARSAMENAQAGEAEARVIAEAWQRSEAETREELDRLREDEARVRRSAQQLLEINRLKSEFIVNAGRELEGSLQTVLGFTELLQQGSYGTLTQEQLEAVRSVYGWVQRMKSDVDWLIEYGSTRSRRLDSSDQE